MATSRSAERRNRSAALLAMEVPIGESQHNNHAQNPDPRATARSPGLAVKVRRMDKGLRQLRGFQMTHSISPVALMAKRGVELASTDASSSRVSDRAPEGASASMGNSNCWL